MAMTRAASHVAINPAIVKSIRRPTILSYSAIRRHHRSLGSNSIRCHHTKAIEPVPTEKDFDSEENLKDLFERWLSYYDLERDLDDKDKRFNVFKDTAKEIYEFNKQGHSYTQGLNPFSAMTHEEFLRTRTFHGTPICDALNAPPLQFFSKDLESEENLWQLYENWCRHYYKINMDLAEKQKRFSVFKENVRYIHDSNKLDMSKLVLDYVADMPRKECR